MCLYCCGIPPNLITSNLVLLLFPVKDCGYTSTTRRWLQYCECWACANFFTYASTTALWIARLARFFSVFHMAKPARVPRDSASGDGGDRLFFNVSVAFRQIRGRSFLRAAQQSRDPSCRCAVPSSVLFLHGSLHHSAGQLRGVIMHVVSDSAGKACHLRFPPY